MDTTRIKELAKAQGKTLSYVCQLIGRKVYYLNDLKKTSEMMADEDLHILAANLGTSAEYLKGETDDPNFHHWTHIRTLHCMGNGIRSNKKTLLTITVGSVLFYSSPK